MKVKGESEKVGLKLNIQKTKIMASGPITLCEIDGETVETVVDFIFLSSKITANGDCSHEIKKHLLLGRKAVTNLVKVKSLSHVRLFATPWTVAYQAPPSMGFSRQGYWSGFHFLLQGIFLTQGSNPGLPRCRQMLYPLSHQGSLDSILKSRDIT